MSDVVDPFADEPVEGIQYVGEDAEPEEVTPESRDANLEEKVVDLPDVMMASDLLPEDNPLSSLPVEPPDDDTPPDEAAPTFIVTPATAQRRESVRLADGTPVGKWLEVEHPSLDGGQVAELLVTMGLDGSLAAWFGIQRDRGAEARKQIAAHPMVAQATAHDAVRLAQKKAVQEAFIKAQKAKT